MFRRTEVIIQDEETRNRRQIVNRKGLSVTTVCPGSKPNALLHLDRNTVCHSTHYDTTLLYIITDYIRHYYRLRRNSVSGLAKIVVITKYAWSCKSPLMLIASEYRQFKKNHYTHTQTHTNTLTVLWLITYPHIIS